MPLANVDGATVHLFPDQADPGGEVLIDLGAFADDTPGRKPVVPKRHRRLVDRWWSLVSTVRQLVDRRIRIMLALLLSLLIAATVFFAVSKHLPLLDSLYFSVVTLATVGYGDIALVGDAPYVKVAGIVFILLGAAAIAVFFSLLTDTIVGARLAEVLGGVRGHLRRHVVVCGVGTLGSKIALSLAELGVAVVVIERDEDNRHVAALRRLGIPVVIGDATLSETLRAAQIGTAEAVVTTTADDIVDLQVAVNARSLHPHIRIVLRLFDRGLASAIEERFDIHISRSSEAIAAPAFAEAVLRQPVVATVTVAGTTMVFAEVVHAGAPRAVADFEQGADLRVLAVTPARGGSAEWRPARDRSIADGESIAVVGRAAAVQALRG